MGRRGAVRRELCVPGFPRAVAVHGNYARGEAVERGGVDAFHCGRGQIIKASTADSVKVASLLHFLQRSHSVPPAILQSGSCNREAAQSSVSKILSRVVERYM